MNCLDQFLHLVTCFSDRVVVDLHRRCIEIYNPSHADWRLVRTIGWRADRCQDVAIVTLPSTYQSQVRIVLREDVVFHCRIENGKYVYARHPTEEIRHMRNEEFYSTLRDCRRVDRRVYIDDQERILVDIDVFTANRCVSRARYGEQVADLYNQELDM